MEATIISLAVVGNVCNFAYNVPFVWVVVKHQNADNISSKFLYLRIFSSIIWILYAIFTFEMFIVSSYSITLLSSFIILYVKLTQDDKQISDIGEGEIPSILIETLV
tara:strand:+ start:144 stop:464 length:321 start_codon:yes stop_codon:yes gene_type:complete